MIILGSFRTRIAKSLTIRGPIGPVKQSQKLLLCEIHQNCLKVKGEMKCIIHTNTIPSICLSLLGNHLFYEYHFVKQFINIFKMI